MFKALMPQRREFFDLLAAHSDRVVAASSAALRLIQALGTPGADIGPLVKEVAHNEKSADQIKIDLIALLHKSFTTPINRDQIHTLTIDLDRYPERAYGIDAFAVPAMARDEFEAAMRRSLAFLDTLPGFVGHVAFEQADGPSTFNIVTIAMWESRAALDDAGAQVRDYYRRIGFDLAATLARWGARAERGTYAPFPSPAAVVAVDDA